MDNAGWKSVRFARITSGRFTLVLGNRSGSSAGNQRAVRHPGGHFTVNCLSGPYDRSACAKIINCRNGGSEARGRSIS